MRERRVRIAVGVGIVVLAVDQMSKAFFDGWRCGAVVCPLRNDEMMLGVIGGSTAVVIFASLVGLGLFWLWVRFANRWTTIPLVASALVVAGVVGNLIDRTLLGSVRDFLAFPADTVVNVADLSLAVGLLIAIGFLILGLATAHSPTTE